MFTNCYNLEKLKLGGSKFSLISYKNDYFPFGFFTGLRDSAEGENNLQYIIDEIKKKGIAYTYQLESDLKNAKK